jgi:hypothetical protein
VLSLGPLKHLVLSVWVVSSEPCPQSPSTEPVPPQAEEEPTVAAAEASCAPPLLVPTAVTEKEQTAAGAAAPLAALETSTEAGPSSEDVVVARGLGASPIDGGL